MSNLPDGWKSIPLSQVMDEKDVKNLRSAAIKARKANPANTIHNIVMRWLDQNPEVTKKAYAAGFIKAYFAYCLEYYLLKDIK